MNETARQSYPDDALLPDTEINGYTIRKVLGRGAFGITYLAEETKLERLVAIKEYLPQTAASRRNREDVVARTGEAGKLFQYGLDNFLEEAKTLVKFSHPNIVRVLTYFTHYQTAYLVMEYEFGMDLNQYLKKNPQPSEQALIGIFSPINRGLSRVHASGYIHRDIKADNIYIREDKSPVLLDFGAARSVVSSDVNQLTRILTIGYAPYEQDNPSWAEQGPWTDIYALGATLYYCVTGKRPVSATERAGAIISERKDPLPSALSLSPSGYSLNFLSAIDKAMRFKPEDRPQNTREWDDMLCSVDSSATVVASSLTSSSFTDSTDPVQPDETLSEHRSGKGSLWLVAGLAIAVVGGSAYFITQPSSNMAEEPVATISEFEGGKLQESKPQESETPAPVTEKSVDTQEKNLDGDKEALSASTVDIREISVTQPTEDMDSAADQKIHMVDQAESIVVSAMVLAKTACWHYARGEKIATLIERIKSLPETSDRTRFIVDQNTKLAQANEGFETNLVQYGQTVEKLQTFPEEALQLALQSFYEQPQYSDDASYQLLGEVLTGHAQMNSADTEGLREDLIEVSMSGVFTGS